MSYPNPMPAPLVTVIMPVFNEPTPFMVESFESLRLQTFGDFECLVVDDSTDPLCAQACADQCKLDRRFVYLRPPVRRGLAAALNLGLDQARGRYIARFDSDDVCRLDRFALQVAFLESHPEIDVLGSALEIIDNTGGVTALKRHPIDHGRIARLMHLKNTIAHPTVMLRTAALKSSGGYDERFRFAEDLELWLRMLNAGFRFHNLAECLVKYRNAEFNRLPEHWEYNIKARMNNNSSEYKIERVIGIYAIKVLSYLNDDFRKYIYRKLMLSPVER